MRAEEILDFFQSMLERRIASFEISRDSRMIFFFFFFFFVTGLVFGAGTVNYERFTECIYSNQLNFSPRSIFGAKKELFPIERLSETHRR